MPAGKGLQLPVNVLVVMIVAIIALAGVLSLFLGGYNQPSGTVGLEGARNAGCTQLLSSGKCSDANAPTFIGIKNYDANEDGRTFQTSVQAAANGDSLAALCVNKYAADVTNMVRTCNIRVCGCPESAEIPPAGGGGGGP